MSKLDLSVLVVSAAALITASAAAETAKVLPLKRVRLYETGVGYFERSGILPGSSVGLPVPAGHLDDALKTLVILGAEGKASVSGVEFESSVSRTMARALAGLPAEGDAPLGFTQLLATLKGAAVEVRSGTTLVRGRLVDVIEPEQSDLAHCEPQKDDKSPCVMVKQSALLVLGEDGAIRRFALADVSSVRPTDPALVARLGAALSALSQHGAQTRKTLHVAASGSTPITLGYVAESPIWRSTYRVVLDPKADRAALQGWALVHNDTDEDWKQVKVELVNGRPDSFLFPLAGPRYARRQLVTPDEELSSVPQLLDTTVDNMWTGDSYGAGGLGLSGVGEGGGGAGEGIGLGSIGTIGHGSGTGTGEGSSSLIGVGNLASIQPADSVENGALFRYSLAQPVDLMAHGSALVPFLIESIPARRVAWFSAPGESARSAVRLENKTHQTLPPGPIAVFADDGFAGESALTRTKPSEARLIAFGVDLDVELTEEKSDSHDETRLVSFSGGALHEHFVRHRHIAYKLVNRSGSGRTAYLTLDVVMNARVTGADSLDFDSDAHKALAAFRVDAHKELPRTLDTDEGLSRAHEFTKLRSTSLVDLAASPLLPAAQRRILEKAADFLLEAEVRRGAIPKRKAELAQLVADIARLRENARAVGAHVQGADQIVKRMLEAEDQAKALRARIAALGTEADERTERARATLATLPKA